MRAVQHRDPKTVAYPEFPDKNERRRASAKFQIRLRSKLCPSPLMETTASWRLLSPSSSSPPAAPQLPRRQAKLAAPPPQRSAKFRALCLLHDKNSRLQRLASALQWGAVWAAVEAPAALAVTGEEDIDILGILPPLAAFAFFYFLVCPVPWRLQLFVVFNFVQPLIMNWMRTRWYKRKFVETYLQFMITYLFYPAKFPRDPTMKYPWSKPKEGTPLFKDRYPPIDTY
ncbi:hypothetical protein HU200_059834 [Digitaria exilis]|uniref:Uncharacterized protein n=1 Tax=Digitaria exilis TaxID=1010633 RepID=A0A835E2Q8_9POAL|nr:hypothetical protein HU200_059834 [Digitaria exilis]